jgi:hypothetical protein
MVTRDGTDEPWQGLTEDNVYVKTASIFAAQCASMSYMCNQSYDGQGVDGVISDFAAKMRTQLGDPKYDTCAIRLLGREEFAALFLSSKGYLPPELSHLAPQQSRSSRVVSRFQAAVKDFRKK